MMIMIMIVIMLINMRTPYLSYGKYGFSLKRALNIVIGWAEKHQNFGQYTLLMTSRLDWSCFFKLLSPQKSFGFLPTTRK